MPNEGRWAAAVSWLWQMLAVCWLCYQWCSCCGCCCWQDGEDDPLIVAWTTLHHNHNSPAWNTSLSRDDFTAVICSIHCRHYVIVCTHCGRDLSLDRTVIRIIAFCWQVRFLVGFFHTILNLHCVLLIVTHVYRYFVLLLLPLTIDKSSKNYSLCPVSSMYMSCFAADGLIFSGFLHYRSGKTEKSPGIFIFGLESQGNWKCLAVIVFTLN